MVRCNILVLQYVIH